MEEYSCVFYYYLLIYYYLSIFISFSLPSPPLPHRCGKSCGVRDALAFAGYEVVELDGADAETFQLVEWVRDIQVFKTCSCFINSREPRVKQGDFSGPRVFMKQTLKNASLYTISTHR